MVVVDCDGDGTFDPVSSSDKTIFMETGQGANSTTWSGDANDGSLVPDGLYDIKVSLLSGEMVLVLDDIETNYEGLRMFRIGLDLSRSSMQMYWGDQAVQPAAVQMPNGQLGRWGSRSHVHSPLADGSFSTLPRSTFSRCWGLTVCC